MPKKDSNLKINKKEKEEIKKEITNEITNDIQKKVEKKVVDSVVNTIKNEAQEQLKDDFVDEVKTEVKGQIIKEEKRLLRHRKWKIIRRDIFIIILCCIIGYLGYLLYKGIDIDISTKNNKVSKSVETKEAEVVKDTNWYIENYGYLLDNMHLKLPGENINKYYLYNNTMDENNINSSIKLIMAYNILKSEKIKDENNTYVISNDDMKHAYNKLFDSEYKESNFSIDCMTYVFNNNKYVALKNECSNINNYEIKEEITNMYEENDYIFIETVMGVTNGSKLYNYTNLYNPITETLDNNLLDYRGSLNSYKYTFRKSGDYYKFIKIEKLI